MKKISVISLLLALVMCVSVILVACEEPPAPPTTNGENPPTPKVVATEAQRKDAVVSYMASLNTDAPGELPALPTMDSIVDRTYASVNGIRFSGTAETDRGEEVERFTFAIKDSTLYITDGEIKVYVFIDEDLNLIMQSEDPDGRVSTTVVPLLAEVPPIDEYIGMIPTFTLPTLPELTAEDLVVDGDRVSLSMDYIKEVFEIVMTAYGEMSGIPEESIPEMIAPYIVMINSMKIDIYFTVNDDARITGYGIDFDLHDAAALLGVEAFSIEASLTVEPETNLPTACSLNVTTATTKTDIAATASYTAGNVTAATLNITSESPAQYDMEGNEVTGARSINELAISFSPAGIAAENAELGKMTGKDSYQAPDGTITVVAQRELTVDKKAGQIAIHFSEETEEMNSTYDILVNIISIPTIPAISTAAAAEKAQAELHITKLVDILTDKTAMESMPAPTEYCSLYYYDEATYTEYWIYGSRDPDTDMFFWDVDFGFATEATNENTVTKNADGSFTVNGGDAQ